MQKKINHSILFLVEREGKGGGGVVHSMVFWLNSRIA